MSINKVKRMLVGLALGTATMVMGFNCGRTGFQSMNMNSDSSSGQSVNLDLPWALLTSEQILKTMVSVAGVESAALLADLGQGSSSVNDPADEEIMRVYFAREGSLPSQKDIQNITGPMMVAVANLSLAVCNKVYERETLAAGASRRFFNEVNFAVAPSAITANDLGNISARMARSFWHRDLTQEELNMISNEMLGPFIQGTAGGTSAAGATKLWSVGLCAAMLSSFDTLIY